MYFQQRVCEAIERVKHEVTWLSTTQNDNSPVSGSAFLNSSILASSLSWEHEDWANHSVTFMCETGFDSGISKHENNNIIPISCLPC